MPSDDSSKSQDSDNKGKSESSSLMIKAVAAVFTTVVAPVLITLGVKFSDVLVAQFQPKPPEAATAEATKSELIATELAKGATEPAKTEGARAEPATTAAGTTKSDSGSEATAAPLVEHKGQFAERGKKKKKNSTTDQPAQGTAGFKSLFNGRDLSGWTAVDGKLWSVDRQNQALVGNNESAASKYQNSWIFTEKEFSDHRLRFEYQMVANTDSGFALRTQPGGNKTENDRFEIQLTNDPSLQNTTGTIMGLRSDAGHPRTKPKTEVSQRGAGEWNLVEIEIRGPHLQMTINGKIVQDVRFDESFGGGKSGKKLLSPTGRLGLQIRTGRVEFRRIEVQELGGGS